MEQNKVSQELELEVFEGGQTKEQLRTPVKKGEQTPTKGKESSSKKEKEVELTEEEKAEKERKYKLATAEAKKILWGYIKKHRCLMAFGILLQFSGMAGEFANPLFIGWVIDAITKKDMDQVTLLVTYWMIINAVASCLSGLQQFIFLLTTQRIGKDLRQDVFEQIINKDVAFFDSRRTGDLISRLSSDTAKIENALSTQFALLIKSSIFCTVIIIMFFLISWKMTFFTLGLLIPSSFVFPIWGRYKKRKEKIISDDKAYASNKAEEAFSNIRTVKAFATEQEECASYQISNKKVYQNGVDMAFYYGMFSFFFTFVMFGTLDLLVWFAAYLNDTDGLTVGEFTSFQFYMFSFLMNFGAIGNVFGEVMGVLGTCAAIAEIFLHHEKIKTTGGDKVTQESLNDGSISLKDIEFHYPTKTDVKVIEKITIEVAKNKTVALVGTSGCGKSTIIQLVERFYDPDGGNVAYGNQDLKQLNPISYKSNMAIVQQEPVLFSGTIRENIIYGLDQEPSERDIDDACKQANAYTFINDEKIFPKRYETVVGERGIKLSGGQKQRIAIARALIRKPKVLLLDEATSALDADSEHQVQLALDAVLENPELTQTVIVIAHRLSTIKDADEILCLNRGKVAERGTHEELINLGGVYKALVERQLMSTDISN